MAKPVVKKSYTFAERIYIVELLKGLALTWKHFIFNVKASFRPGPHTVPTTWQYPEDRREISPNFRGEHLLLLDEMGREKCVGCGMCAKICPAQCIMVEMAKVGEGEETRYAGKTYCKSFSIDLLRCIFCGFCAETCPKEAIALGQGYELSQYTSDACHLTKEKLLANYQSAKTQGKLPPPRKAVPVAGADEKKAGSAEEKTGTETPAVQQKPAGVAKPKAQGKASSKEAAEQV